MLFGPANGLTEVAMENEDIGRGIPIGIIGGANPDCDPFMGSPPPNMLRLVMTVFRGPTDAPIPNIGVVAGKPCEAIMGWPNSDPAIEPGPPWNGKNGNDVIGGNPPLNGD